MSVNGNLQQLIINKLSEFGGCAYVRDLARELNADPNDIALALSDLAKQGLVYRDEKSTLDFTRPLLTSKWCLKSAPKQAASTIIPTLGEVVEVILSPPLIRDLANWAKDTPVVGLLDSLHIYLCNAKRSVKIAVPFIGDILGILTMECINNIKDVEFKVITEDDSRRDIEILKGVIPKLSVLYATKRTKDGTKVRGIHAKFMIIDDEVAIIGTFNLTKYHLFVHYDLGIVVKGPIVKFLNDLFEHMWKVLSEGGVPLA